jgi:predicted hotdog family 3-hydroxylacyl-ACP dehydratase
MHLDRDEISKIIPHAGAMVLLDRVVNWDSSAISCITESHLRLDNPLRRGDMLQTVAGVELAGQAMAIHARLIANAPKRLGLLGGLRDVHMHRDRLDTCREPLVVNASLLTRGDVGRMYSFSILVGAGVVMQGRASVFFL